MAIHGRKFGLLLLSLLHFTTMGVNGDRILFFMNVVTSHSHRHSIQPLVEKLAERGHEVTFHSPIRLPKEHPKVKEFCAPELTSFLEASQASFGVEGLKARLASKHRNEIFESPSKFFGMEFDACDKLLSSSATLEWIDKNKWDLIIYDSLANECVYGIAYYTGAKMIMFDSVGTNFMWELGIFGLSPEISWLPSLDTVHDHDMGFFQRLRNAYVYFLWSWYYVNRYIPQVDGLVREKLGDRVKGMPYLEQVMKDNTALIFLNQHYSDQYSRPAAPFVVSVGGMHIQEANATLPGDIQEFIGKSSEGFIYISFGTVIQISTMPESLLQTFFEAMRKSKLQFLWKWEGEIPKNHPANIMFKKFFPQQNILTHKKIRGFVTQGGHVSFQQANCNGVPLILFPSGGDQDFSAKRAKALGNGIPLELAGLKAFELEQAFDKLLNDPSYKKTAERLAVACKDRPMSPVDTAVWWTEYALRTEDTTLLKPGSINQPLWMHWCLDIWAFVFSVLLLALLGLGIITHNFKIHLSNFWRREKAKEEKETKLE